MGDCAASADAASGNGDGSAAGGSSGEGICSTGGCTLDSGSGGTGGVAGQCAATEADASEFACAPNLLEAEFFPLDIYILFDQSGSMSEDAGGITRMDAVRDALGRFLLHPLSSGMGAGIGYFGDQPIGQASCDPAAYAQADVGIDTLPNNAQPIIDSLAGREPTGETPTGAALRGACSYAKAWKQGHPTHEVVVLLVTDGVPQAPTTCAGGGACCPTLEDAVAAASECASGVPGVEVYVLGIGPELESLSQLAIAGNTEMAYLVAGGDVTVQAIAALDAIRAAATSCRLQMPELPGEPIDLDKINIEDWTNPCELRTLIYRDALSGCDPVTGGWYFDNPLAPVSIQLCPETCDALLVQGRQLTFAVGCPRIF